MKKYNKPTLFVRILCQDKRIADFLFGEFSEAENYADIVSSFSWTSIMESITE